MFFRRTVIGDRGYDSNRIRRSLVERNITGCIPSRKSRKSKPSYNWHLYKKRHLIENMFAKLKRLATCCDQIRLVRPAASPGTLVSIMNPLTSPPESG
ncbi:transposase [Gluconacetobacter entanii]|uniref:transposase n=1 Tax=Gluconacetobacter entanii TaxID=108528 RepID=UPI0036F27D47